MVKHIEDDHQKHLIQWADLQRLNALHGHSGTIGQYLIHIPNGGKRNQREAARLKAQGVRAGFPDLFLFIPSYDFHGLAIEMKRPIVKGQPKPTVTAEQKKWLERLANEGYETAICYGWHEAREKILQYLGYDKRI